MNSGRLITLLVVPTIVAYAASGAACSTGTSASLTSDTRSGGEWQAPPRPIKGHYPGGGANGYDRQTGRVHWRDGATVAYGATFLLAASFMRNIESEVDLVRWDDYDQHPSATAWGGIGIFKSDRLARLMRFDAAGDLTVLVGPFKLPVGRWFQLKVRQRFSDRNGHALNQVYLDNHLIGTSHLRNTYGNPIDHLRAGLVAIGVGEQTSPLTLSYGDWFATGLSPRQFSHNVLR